MKKMKITALCLSAAITLSTFAGPVLADNNNRDHGNQTKATISTNKDNFNFRFSDSKDYMKDMAWALKAIEKLGAKGIISGYTDKSYKPQNKVTNMEALSLILKLTGREDSVKLNENKVNTTLAQYKNYWNLKWGWGNVYVAVDEGILLPEELKNFNPNQPIKRHEVAKYLIRAIGQKNKAIENMDSILTFKDKDAIPKSSIGYVYMINKLGIMTGNANNQFKPNEPLTRAEIAVLIDKADGKLDNTNDNQDKEKIVFSSYDEDTNRLYVKGTSKYFTTIENVLVYKNNHYEDINELVAGDVLDIVFNSSKQVIFIEVVKEAVENEDNYDREDVSFSSVEYSDIPKVIQDKVDTLRATKGYYVYKYENEIYLAVYMGKKNTGGYSVEINDVLKYEQSNDKYIVEAFVKETEPDSDSMVTQSITYPYTVVKFNNIDTIEKINFLNEDNDILASKSIVNLNDESTVAGVLSYIDADYNYIKIMKDNKLIRYELASDVLVYIQNEKKAIEDLNEDMNVKLTVVNDEVIKISADYDLKEIKGIVQNVYDTDNRLRVKTNNVNTTYTVEDDAEITLNDKTSNLEALETGMEVELQLVNNKITKIDAVDVEESYKGTIKDLDFVSGNLKSITLLLDGTSNTRKTFTVTEDTEVIMLDDNADEEDLAYNSIVAVELVNGNLVKIEELD